MTGNDRHHPFNIARERELLFARACGGLAFELRKGGPDLYVAAFSMNAGLALEEAVESCIRRSFGADAIRFAGSGGFELGWDSTPRVHLDFELVADGVFACFRLSLDGAAHDVRIDHISFEDGSRKPLENTMALERILLTETSEQPEFRSSAHRSPPPQHLPPSQSPPL
jgi:hypothetical protein